MSDSVRHLFWGVSLFILYVLLAAMVAPLMALIRVSAPLAPSQTFALLAVGELVSFLPFLGAAKRCWSIETRAEWITFTLFGAVLACNFSWGIYCCQHMPLGGLFSSAFEMKRMLMLTIIAFLDFVLFMIFFMKLSLISFSFSLVQRTENIFRFFSPHCVLTVWVKVNYQSN